MEEEVERGGVREGGRDKERGRRKDEGGEGGRGRRMSTE